MSHNILITGAAGYLGGSILFDFQSKSDGLIKNSNIFAAVRGEDQFEAFQKLGIKVIQLDLGDEAAVTKAVEDNQIDIIINSAASWDSQQATNLIKALGQQKRQRGKQTYFVQTSVLELYTGENGWPEGEIKDTNPVYDLEKKYNIPSPLSETNVTISELGEEEGVTTFIVPAPPVYGRGTGPWRKLSVNIPAYVRASLKDRTVHRFEKDAAAPATHVSDLTTIYTLIIEKAVQGEPISSGKEGYYFAMAHRAPWWEVMDRIAKHMYARGLVDTPEVKTWPSLEIAAKKLDFPIEIIAGMTMSGGDMVAENAYKLGWRPKWDQERFLNSIDDEIQAVLDLDTVKPTLFAPMLK